MTLLLVYMALALGVSFLCSVMEAVLLSVSPSFVARQEQEGKLVDLAMNVRLAGVPALRGHVAPAAELDRHLARFD